MKKHHLMGIVSGINVSGAVAVNASLQSTTIESCALLLPSGHNFEVSIIGTIDTTGNTRSFSGQFDLSDGTATENEALEQSAEPFANCVSTLLR